jgi:MFS family permease
VGRATSVRPSTQEAAASTRSRRGLDWFTFFVADLQTGFGPFVAIYLTANAWTQSEIGLVLTVGGLVALAGQMPGGAIVDSMRSPRTAAGIAVAAIGLSALVLAAWPIFALVMASRILHASASCVLGPAIPAISLNIVGHDGLGERLGRNVRFMSAGSLVAAAAMGAIGHFISNQAIFLVTAALVAPTLWALAYTRTQHQAQAAGLTVTPTNAEPVASIRAVLTDRTLLIFAGCILLFHLANAATLPLMGGILTSHAPGWATATMSACIIVPQLLVALSAPWIGRQAEQWGRRPLLMLAFVALILRALLFAVVRDPGLVIAAQLLDGVSAAAIGIMFPLICADITRRTGRFSLALGIVGSAVGLGASFSTLLGGLMFDHAGAPLTFLALAAVAGAGLVLVWLVMPETGSPQRQALPGGSLAAPALQT